MFNNSELEIDTEPKLILAKKQNNKSMISTVKASLYVLLLGNYSKRLKK
ncbi:hypothetical protein GCM10022395_35140 [Snuella lapsa]|uniref:Uncharacterized protein n=1 Tax=Snuella lapsa TaxID=870481 RepID=A0ABP6YI76_9FLAO